MPDVNYIKKKNQDFFNKDQIHFYNINNNFLLEFFNRRLTSSFAKFIKYIPIECLRDKQILDAGCNDGYFFDFYKAHGAKRIIGCDISRGTMLRGLKRGYGILRDKNKALKIKNFVQGDLESMPLKNASFDSVLCFGTWHHLIRKDFFLKECRRILKKDGFLIISDPNKLHPLRKIVDIIGVKMNWVIAEERYHTTPEYTKNMLIKYGFIYMRIYYYNLFSAILSYFCNIILQKRKKFFLFFALLFLPIALVDLFLEKTILKILPRFAWTYTIICQNSN